MNNKPLNPWQKIQFGVMFCLLHLLRCLGFTGIYHLGGGLGFLLWHLAPARRRYTIRAVCDHLHTSEAEGRRIAKASFKHNLRSFLELALVKDFPLHGNPRLAPCSPCFTAYEADPRPIVGFSAHLGAWEFLSSIMGQSRTAYRRIIIARNQENPAANALIHYLRSSPGNEIVGHRNASARVLGVLRDNGSTAFMVDHNTNRREAIFLPFLGEEAAVNLGPALLALRSKATLYPFFILRKPGPNYELFTLPPLDTCTLEGTVAEKTRAIAEFYTRTVEAFVLKYPEQWFWMHRRWKTRPQPAPDQVPPDQSPKAGA